MSRPTTSAYHPKNWPTYNEARKHQGSLTGWFGPRVSLSFADSQAWPLLNLVCRPQTDASLMKVSFDMALRQTTGFVASPFK